MKSLNANFLSGNASFLIPLKEAEKEKTVFQYLVWFALQNRAKNQHMGKNNG